MIDIRSIRIGIRLLVNLKINYLSLWSHLQVRAELSRILGTVPSRIRFLNIDLHLKIPLTPILHSSTPILDPHCELHIVLLLAAYNKSFSIKTLFQACDLPFKVLVTLDQFFKLFIFGHNLTSEELIVVPKTLYQGLVFFQFLH